MRIQTFDWNEWNVNHIARHGLEPHEVEAACRAEVVVRHGREGRYLLYGRTAEGRYLFIVLRSLGGGVGRVITARGMTHSEQRFYQRRR